MGKGRLEAFSDGVIAIIITVMVLELKAPHGSQWSSLVPVIPSLLAYALSFVFLGIYWSNHHHMLHLADRISGGILWANLHLLFWLSLVPFVTSWVAEDSTAAVPTALYALVFLLAAIAYTVLQQMIIAHQGPHSKLKAAIGSDTKGKMSVALYLSAIALAFVHPWISDAIIVIVALMWLVPDRRIETRIESVVTER
jgi:uncharacterized membrane protein